MTKYRKAMNIPSSRQRRDWSLEESNGGPAAGSNGHPHAEDHDDEDDDHSATNGHTPIAATSAVSEGAPELAEPEFDHAPLGEPQ